MSEESLVSIGIEGYLAFFAALAVMIGVIYWVLGRRERQARDHFLGQFRSSELRMSPYKIGLVYRVVSASDEKIVVIPIWDGRASIVDGEERQVTADELIPFDRSRFFL